MSTVKQLGCVLATMFVVALVAPGAFAADLGGNCCADLEERIAELEASTAKVTNKGKVRVEVTGVVNEALIAWGDGILGKANSAVIPNGVNPSRFAFVASSNLGHGYSAGATFSIYVGQWDALTGSGMLGGIQANGQSTLAVREASAYISTSWGKVTLGKTAQATYKIADQSTANVQDADELLSFAPLFGGPGATEVLDFYSGQYLDVVRFETQKYNGVVLSASWGRDGEVANFATGCGTSVGAPACQKNEWDVAARWEGGYQQFKGKAGVGYREGGVFTGLQPLLAFPMLAYADKTYSGGLSVMHAPTGWFADGAYGHTDLTGTLGGPGVGKPTIVTWEVRTGVEEHWVQGLGKTTVYVEYADMKLDNILNGLTGPKDTSTDVKWWGVGVVQALNEAVNVYANVKDYMLGSDLKDNNVCTGVCNGPQAKDTTVGMVGAAIKF